MLQFLQIRDYTIVDSLELDFADGFTCITGETGAGKSILVGALGLLCGNRADTGDIRQGAEKAELVAEFQLDESDPALSWLRETELDQDSDCLLRRVIHVNGRSRAWINGTAVTLQQLADLGELLVEIHGQNEHLRLIRTKEQFRLLDGAGSHEKERIEVRDRYFAWHELEMEKQALLGQSPLDAGDLDLLKYQVSELESGILTADEFSRLEKEHRKLAHGSEIVAALEFALQSLQSDQSGVSGELHRTARELEQHASLDNDIATAAALLNEAAINCDEAGATVQNALSRMDLSPERLAELERQLGAQHDLARKHRVEPEQLEQVLEQLLKRLELAGSQEKRLAGIDAELESTLHAYRRAAQSLYARRQACAADLSAGVTELMQHPGRYEKSHRVVNFHASALPSRSWLARTRDRRPRYLTKLTPASGGRPPVPSVRC
jgi:DNA repair protein RecN (Recombination protein N)